MTLKRNHLINRAVQNPLVSSGLEVRVKTHHALLSPEALTFVRSLTRRFRSARNSLIEKGIVEPKVVHHDFATTLARQQQSSRSMLVRSLGLEESQVLVDGQNIPAGILDLGLFLFHNQASRPEILLPLLSHHLEARLWNDMLLVAEDELKIGRGTIRVSVSSNNQNEISMILFELREHVMKN